MATNISKHTNVKQQVRFKRKRRISAKVSGTMEKPRFAIFRSNRYLYAQLIDDSNGHTLVAASTLEEDLKGKVTKTIESAKALGELVAKRAQAKNITQVVFDRSGYLYHGRVKAIADGAREGGLKF